MSYFFDPESLYFHDQANPVKKKIAEYVCSVNNNYAKQAALKINRDFMAKSIGNLVMIFGGIIFFMMIPLIVATNKSYQLKKYVHEKEFIAVNISAVLSDRESDLCGYLVHQTNTTLYYQNDSGCEQKIGYMQRNNTKSFTFVETQYDFLNDDTYKSLQYTTTISTVLCYCTVVIFVCFFVIMFVLYFNHKEKARNYEMENNIDCLNCFDNTIEDKEKQMHILDESRKKEVYNLMLIGYKTYLMRYNTEPRRLPLRLTTELGIL